VGPVSKPVFKGFVPQPIDVPVTPERINRLEERIKNSQVELFDAVWRNFLQIGGTPPVPGLLDGPAVVWTDAGGVMHVDPAHLYYTPGAVPQLVVPPGTIGTGTPPFDTGVPGLSFGTITDGFVYDTATDALHIRLNNGIWYSFQKNALTMSSLIAVVNLGNDGGVGILRLGASLQAFFGGDFVVGQGGPLLTTATGGFIDLPSMPGPPTAGAAFRPAGYVPLVIDSAHYRAYIRDLANTIWMPIGQYTGAADGILQTVGGLWSVITIGSGLSFSGGTLTATGSGGTVTGVSGTSPIVITGGASPTPNVTITDFVASGASHARGAVPDPGASAGTTHFLREDATWAVPPDTGITQLTGDVTAGPGSGSQVATLHNIPDGTTAAGRITFTDRAAPSAPPGGEAEVYVDSTSKNLACKNDTGVINHGIRTQAGTTHQFVKSVADDGSSATAVPDALLETSGPTTLVMGAVPDNAPDSTTFIRPAGSSTIQGVATKVLAASVAPYFMSFSGKINTADSTTVFYLPNGGQLVSGEGVTANEYPLNHAFTTALFRVNILDNNGTSGTWSVTLWRNGAPTAITASYGPGTTGVQAAVTGSLAAGSVNDTFGLVYDGTALNPGGGATPQNRWFVWVTLQ